MAGKVTGNSLDILGVLSYFQLKIKCSMIIDAEFCDMKRKAINDK